MDSNERWLSEMFEVTQKNVKRPGHTSLVAVMFVVPFEKIRLLNWWLKKRANAFNVKVTIASIYPLLVITCLHYPSQTIQFSREKCVNSTRAMKTKCESKKVKVVDHPNSRPPTHLLLLSFTLAIQAEKLVTANLEIEMLLHFPTANYYFPLDDFRRKYPFGMISINPLFPGLLSILGW